MTTDIVTSVAGYEVLPIQQVRNQINFIQALMKEVMKEGEHFGTIPGCGPKPALLKPGAEKLNLTFQLTPLVDKEEIIDLPGGHREYRFTIGLYTRDSMCLGQGVGSACTMEGKWRYRTGPKESTGKPVPGDYWNLRKTNPDKAQELLGGKGFSVSKNDAGAWEIVKMGEKVEHDNPADYYNTARKIGKKRALIDADMTVLAVSDIFTQDIEEMVEVFEGAAEAAEEAPKEVKKPRAKQPDKKPDGITTTESPKHLLPDQLDHILEMLSQQSTTDEVKICKAFGVSKLEDIPYEKYSTIVDGLQIHIERSQPSA